MNIKFYTFTFLLSGLCLFWLFAHFSSKPSFKGERKMASIELISYSKALKENKNARLAGERPSKEKNLPYKDLVTEGDDFDYQGRKLKALRRLDAVGKENYRNFLGPKVFERNGFVFYEADSDEGSDVVYDENSQEFLVMTNKLIVKLKEEIAPAQVMSNYEVSLVYHSKGANLAVFKNESKNQSVLELYQFLKKDHLIESAELELLGQPVSPR